MAAVFALSLMVLSCSEQRYRYAYSFLNKNSGCTALIRDCTFIFFKPSFTFGRLFGQFLIFFHPFYMQFSIFSVHMSFFLPILFLQRLVVYVYLALYVYCFLRNLTPCTIIPPCTSIRNRRVFAQKMQADPKFLHHLEGPQGCFQNLKKKIRIFFKILDFGPENGKM